MPLYKHKQVLYIVLQARKKNNMYKEELIDAVYHPDRVEKGIHKYGMEFIDAL